MDINKEYVAELKKILKKQNIRTLFQPIISLSDASILGYEALTRGPKGSILEMPAQLFATAEYSNLIWELEQLCRVSSIKRASKFKGNKYLFLNVDPNVINDPNFQQGFTKEFLAEHNLTPQSIIFEITEKTAVNDFAGFRKITDNYVAQGFKIAIDDTGSGYSGLRMLAEIGPKYIKIDMELVRNIDKDFLKQALLKTFQQFSVMTNMKIIAEGIETMEELATLMDIGVNYGQGFLLQRPSEVAQIINPAAVEYIKYKNNNNNDQYPLTASAVKIGSIANRVDPITKHTKGKDVDKLFKSNPQLQGVPVVDDNNVPLGVVMRDKFYYRLSSQYGVVIFYNRPIDIMMDQKPLMFEHTTTLSLVTQTAMLRPDNEVYDSIIITKDDKYHGIITVKNLLEHTSRLELNVAIHSNPLTSLPGNIIIEQKLNEVIKATEPYSIIYIDLDNFKAYNDVYGFESGDKVLLSTSKIISTSINHKKPTDTFLGHIGGDDFIIVTPGYEVHDLCNYIVKQFNDSVKEYYNEKDLNKGFIFAENRNGEYTRFPLMSLSVAVITNRRHDFKNVYELSAEAARMKHKAKTSDKKLLFMY